jgi:hypothetical protein
MIGGGSRNICANVPFVRKTSDYPTNSSMARSASGSAITP